MTKKKTERKGNSLANLDELGGLVYSTEGPIEQPEPEVQATPEPAQQDLRIRLDRLKGNKVVTVITGFVGAEDDLQALGKSLKQACGVGGSAKNYEILLQGDHRKKAGEWLGKQGYRYKFSGG